MKSKILCIFDANGTIFNDLSTVWYPAVTEVFRVCGKTPFTAEEYFRELENYGDDYLAIYRSRGVTLPRKALNAIYITEYGKRMQNVELSPGIKEALSTLQQLDCKTGIITLQPKSLFCPLMDKFGLWDFFDKNYVLWEKANKSMAIRRLAYKSGLAVTVYVGDSPSDMRHAKKAGATAVAYLNGFVPKDLVLKTEPHYCVSHFFELPPLVERLLNIIKAEPNESS